SVSSRKIDDAFARKIARATSTVALSSSRCPSSAPSTPAATAACRSLMADVRRCEVEDALHLERSELGMLREDERTQTADVGRREAVAGAAQGAAAEPRDVELETASKELHRRRRVRVERERVGVFVAADGDDACESPRKALHRHVVRRCDEQR